MTSRLLEDCYLFWRISLTSSITETYEILFKKFQDNFRVFDIRSDNH